MPLIGIKIERFSALMNGVFIGVGIIFLVWGATDIIFPITDRMNVAVFGLTNPVGNRFTKRRSRSRGSSMGKNWKI